MSFDNILGQEKALEILRKSILTNSMAHAYVFYGPDGVGKMLLAVELAKSLNCLQLGPLDNCGNCNSCRRIEERTHPDFFSLAPSKNTTGSKEAFIRAEPIRQLQKKLNFKPYEGRVKVVVVDAAGQMNHQAANIFLKTLEEPPPNTLIILIASNHYQLLPTIISRCQGVKFEPLSKEVLKKILYSRSDIDSTEAEFRVARAGGSANQALDDGIIGKAEIRNELIELLIHLSFEEINHIFNWTRIWAKKPDQLHDMLDELSVILRDVSVTSSGGQSYLVNQDLLHQIKSLAAKKKLSSWLKMFQSVSDTRQALKSNQNVQLSLEIMLMRFCEVN